jgi:PIN domain nuclease of toxin-antitoxin system
MLGVVADTHAFVWYITNRSRLSAVARETLDRIAAAGGAVIVSAISLVEITYLVEKSRLPQEVGTRVRNALKHADFAFALAPLDAGVADSLARVPREQISDMPDRIIAATALHLGLPLVTRDGRIRASNIETVW